MARKSVVLVVVSSVAVLSAPLVAAPLTDLPVAPTPLGTLTSVVNGVDVSYTVVGPRDDPRVTSLTLDDPGDEGMSSTLAMTFSEPIPMSEAEATARDSTRPATPSPEEMERGFAAAEAAGNAPTAPSLPVGIEPAGQSSRTAPRS